MKKTLSIAFLLLLSILMLILTGCESAADTADENKPENTESNNSDLVLVQGGETNYRVVRSDLAGSTSEYQAAINLRKYFRACGVDMDITTDWEKNGIIDWEIIVGDTTREFEFDPHSVGEEGFIIKAVGTRLFIDGGSLKGVEAGVEYFITEFLGYGGDIEKGSAITELTIPGDYEYIQRQKYDITSMTLGGRPLGDYVLEAKNPSLKSQAEYIQNYLYKNMGIWLNIVEAASADQPALRLTTGGDDNFEIKKDGTNYLMQSMAADGIIRGFNNYVMDHIKGKKGDLTMNEYKKDYGGYVTYEEFGAVGDGEHDDFPAIIEAHAFANKNNYKVKAKDGATYYIGASEKHAEIQTDTDWGKAKFIIDDRSLTNITVTTFKVTSKLQTQSLAIGALKQNQENIGTTLQQDSFVVLYNDKVRRYIRYGANANDGAAQTEGILVSKDGTVDKGTPIIWDYDTVTSAYAYPVDSETLTIKGGEFTTIVFDDPKEFKYYGRGITISRSNTVVDGVTHYITNEGPNGSAYSSFIGVSLCANVRVQNCLLTPHKTFRGIKADGKEMTMGTYDINCNRAANVTFYNVTQTIDIMDSKYWGILGTNYCKNLTYDHCELSRFDAHCGVANATIKDTTLGYAGLNAIGFGTLLVENSTIKGSSLVNLRTDYGSTWQGEVIIKNCTFVPRSNSVSLIASNYTGKHDFGYTCYMPSTVTIDGLKVMDGNRSNTEVNVFSNPNASNTSEAYVEDYPYVMPKTVTVTGFESEKNSPLYISQNQYMFRNTELIKK